MAQRNVHVSIVAEFRPCIETYLSRLFIRLLFGLLFWVSMPFETIFQSVSEKENNRQENNSQTTSTRVSCKHSRSLFYYLPKLVGRHGTESHPAPPSGKRKIKFA